MRSQIAACLALALLAGSATAQDSERVQTTKDANQENLAGAVQAPLRDVNVVRTKVPPVLLEAMADPYGRPQRPTCVQIAGLIRPIDEALGPDLDTIAAEKKSNVEKGKTTAMGAVAGLASDMIPFRGFVRKLSGAEQHDEFVQAAIIAGNVRRAYLKGLGESRGCAAPATPLHLLAGDPAVKAPPR